jgi:hypothetical protein
MNEREIIEIDGHPLRIVWYSGPLFRSDLEHRHSNTANLFYRNSSGRVYNKYFTKTKQEAAIAYPRPHIHEWVASDPLRLVDILHLKTRDSLSQLINPENLNVSFPVETMKNKSRKVYRFSNSEATNISHDNEVLAQLCELGHGIDGYYMERQELPMEGKKHPTLTNFTIKKEFHSEIGVCKESLHKLKLVKAVKRLVAPPPPNRGKSRKNRAPPRVIHQGPIPAPKEALSLPFSLSNLTQNVSSPKNNKNEPVNLNLSAMISENRPFFGIAPTTPTKKRPANNNSNTSPRKTVKQRNNILSTPPRGKILFPLMKKK